MKKVKYLPLALIICLCLSGCGKMTAPRLAVKMARAMSGKQITQMDMNMEADVDVKVEYFGMSIAASMEMEWAMDMVMDYDPFRSYSDAGMELTLNIMEQDLTVSETMQIYTLTDGNKTTTYTHSDTTGLWLTTEQTAGETGTESGSPESAAPKLDYSFLTKKVSQELILAEEPETVGGTECYVLSTTLTGQELQALTGQLGGLETALQNMGLEDLDWTKLNIPAEIYVSCDTFLPVKLELTIQGVDGLLGETMEQMLGADQIQTEMGDIEVEISGIGFDAVTVPQVPDEALK